MALALSMKNILGDRLSLLINKSDLFYKKKNIDWKKLEELTGLKVLICSALKDDKVTENEIDDLFKAKKFLKYNKTPYTITTN